MGLGYNVHRADMFIFVKHDQTRRTVARFTDDVDGRYAFDAFLNGLDPTPPIFDTDKSEYVYPIKMRHDHD